MSMNMYYALFVGFVSLPFAVVILIHWRRLPGNKRQKNARNTLAWYTVFVLALIGILLLTTDPSWLMCLLVTLGFPVVSVGSLVYSRYGYDWRSDVIPDNHSGAPSLAYRMQRPRA